MGLETIIPAALAGALAILVVFAVRAGTVAAQPLAHAAQTHFSRQPVRLVLIGLAAVFLLSWFWRFDVAAVSHGDQSVVYRLDRWTGQMSFCAPTACRGIKQE